MRIEIPLQTESGRNRYIVECKDELGIMSTSGKPRRNRYIVKCKEGRAGLKELCKSVEIDTLWNVKLLTRGCKQMQRL